MNENSNIFVDSLSCGPHINVAHLPPNVVDCGR